MKNIIIHVLCSREKYNDYFIKQSQNEIVQISLINHLNSLQLFGISLGNCLGEFVLRFLERRKFKPECLINMEWSTNQVGKVNISDVNINIEIEPTISNEEEVVLMRILHQCPVHSMISGNVKINIKIAKSDINHIIQNSLPKAS